MNRSDTSEPCLFSEGDRIRLHQLRVRQEIAEPGALPDSSNSQTVGAQPKLGDLNLPWDLLAGRKLTAWQTRCADLWFQHAGRGTIKVVTGAGKTVLALAIAQRLQQDDPELCVAIIVPTIVLMSQWFAEFQGSNIPESAIGRLGGGHDDSFVGRRILIAVLNSAQAKLSQLASHDAIGSHLLLVADECHRAGAPEMSRVLRTVRRYSLGLSATPERGDDESGQTTVPYGESRLGSELGPIIYELTLDEAVKFGVIPHYTIKHYGVGLSKEERLEYDRLSRMITQERSDLQERIARRRSKQSFFAAVQRLAKNGTGEVAQLASQFLSHTSVRKQLLYGAWARVEAVVSILRDELNNSADASAIIFHETIGAVERLFCRLESLGMPVVLEHSKLPATLREESLDLFRSGIARIIVSAKTLIEGFNMPSVDVGLIAASSTSVRQRIQSMGRVLRKHRSSSGVEKSPTIYVIYVRDSADEVLYEREDWGKITGAERNAYFFWSPETGAVPQAGPPRESLPSDQELDGADLSKGDTYPGRLEGEIFSVDSNRNVRDASGRFVTGADLILDDVMLAIGRVGRFYVTPRKRFVLVRCREGDEWVTLFAGVAPEFGFAVPLTTDNPLERKDWLKAAMPGDAMPFEAAEPIEQLWYRRKMGGVLAKKVPGGERFALTNRATDKSKGTAAQELRVAIRELLSQGETVSEIELDSEHVATYRKGGQRHFIRKIGADLEFPT